MLVQDVMQKKVLTVAPETPLEDVERLAARRGIRHLPVLEQGRLVGIISDRDLKAAMSWVGGSGRRADRWERARAAEIMSHPVVTIAPMFPVEEAARLMVAHKISALPVTEAGEVVGILTETDLLQIFVRTLGVAEPSSRLEVALGDRPEALADVLRTLEAAGAVISSVMALTTPSGLREAVIRVATINPGPAIRALEARGYTVRDSWRGSPPGPQAPSAPGEREA